LVVATSQRIKEELIGLEPRVDPDKILVKPNAINSETFPVVERKEPGPGEPFRLVCVNRIEPKKGLTYLVKALHTLKAEGFPVELHILGEADAGIQSSVNYRDKLVAQLDRDDMWGTVHLEGRQNEQGVRRFLSMAQLFLAPFVETDSGDKDGIPTALLEAMASGIPPLASNAGSIEEVIDHGVDGIIVPQKNATALATQIKALLQDPARRQQLGQQAAAKIRSKFDVRVCETHLHQRIRAAIDPRSSASK
jgi:colanic acid/amylovoran biosynthesis glycosyltransferase